VLITRYDSARAARGEMLSIEDILEILATPLLGIIPESQDVLRASNVGSPVTLNNAASAPAAPTSTRRAGSRARPSPWCADRAHRPDESPAGTEGGMIKLLRRLGGRPASAPVARERLQILLAHERGLRGQPDLLGLLRAEILAASRGTSHSIRTRSSSGWTAVRLSRRSRSTSKCPTVSNARSLRPADGPAWRMPSIASTAIASSPARTRRPWDAGMQHGSAPAALVVWAAEAILTPEPMQIARVTIDLMRPVPMTPLTLQSEVLRQGRKIQLCASGCCPATPSWSAPPSSRSRPSR